MRATVERERGKVGHHASHWVTLVAFAERARHLSPSCVTCSGVLKALLFLRLLLHFAKTRTDQLPLLLCCFPCCRVCMETADSTLCILPTLCFNGPIECNRFISAWLWRCLPSVWAGVCFPEQSGYFLLPPAASSCWSQVEAVSSLKPVVWVLTAAEAHQNKATNY